MPKHVYQAERPQTLGEKRLDAARWKMLGNRLA